MKPRQPDSRENREAQLHDNQEPRRKAEHLHAWQRAGFVELVNREIIVTNLTAIEKLAGASSAPAEV